MKQYYLNLTVPDDFDPEKLEISANYPEGDLILQGEGFIDVENIADQLKVNVQDLAPNSVVLFKYSKELMNEAPMIIPSIQKMLEDKLGNTATVVGLVDDVDILIQNSSEAINMLKKMIDKINSKAIIKIM